MRTLLSLPIANRSGAGPGEALRHLLLLFGGVDVDGDVGKRRAECLQLRRIDGAQGMRGKPQAGAVQCGNSARDLLQAGLVTGAMSTDAARGSDAPFDARVQALRGHPGQIACADALRALMAGSAIRASHLEADDRVQDPYCLRCQPQVMGAALDVMRQAAGVLALALCEVGSLAERRIAMLVDPAQSRLPAFLTPKPGLNSGFMVAQVTAAALVAENKQRAAPASSIPSPPPPTRRTTSPCRHTPRGVCCRWRRIWRSSSASSCWRRARAATFMRRLHRALPWRRCAGSCAPRFAISTMTASWRRTSMRRRS
jgi:hypothetical protein